MLKRIEVPTGKPATPQGLAWLGCAGLAIAIGLLLTVGVLLQVSSFEQLLWSLILVGPGCLFVVTGTAIVLRVTGMRPHLRIKDLIGLSWTAAAILASIGTLGALFFWAVGRSSWVHEGGDLADYPPDAMIAAGIGAGLVIASIALGMITSRIEDPEG